MKKTKHFFHFGFNLKRFTAALTALFLLLTPFSAFADVLGTPGTSKVRQFAMGTTIYTNTFFDSAVGQQTEHYISYTPNPDVIPILTNGYSVYGKRTIAQENAMLNSKDIPTAAGINADFFSLQTGVPMSNVVIDRRVVSKDDSNLDAVGFKADGTAFMGRLPITTTITSGKDSTDIECINKYRQPYAIYLYTEEFAEETYAEGEGINIILGSVSETITLNSTVTAVVESVTTDEGSVRIPEGKFLISVSTAADPAILERISFLTEGRKITIKTSDASNDKRWNDAIYALGNLGGKLITDGELDYVDDSAAPRTAIGIKEDGTIIFYTIDGRQSGYSYGVRKATLAKRLLELGCVEAINLDGGGSTAIGGTMPGTGDFKILNSPSDGGLRKCANFFFLKKTNEPTGIPYILNVSDWGQPVLSGSSIQLKVDSAYDTFFGPATLPDDIEFSLEKDAGTASPDGKKSEVTKNGLATIRGNGDVFIVAKSKKAGVEGSTMIRAVATPDRIQVSDKNTGKDIYDISVEPETTLNLSATAFWGGQAMVVADNSFTWRVVSDDESIGEITDDGVFTTSSNSGATGIIAVNAGLCTAEIPVEIPKDDSIPVYDNYPEISGAVSGGKLAADISYSGGTISKNNIQLYVDGTSVDFDYNGGKLTYSVPDNSYHRLTLVVTSENGSAAIKSFDSGILAGITNPFPDTAEHWARPYISYMASKGVVSGSSEDGSLENVRFLPDDNMTRTEFAIMLCNYLGVNVEDYKDVELPFTDNADIPWWAIDRVKAIYSLGLMKGQLTDYGVEFKPNDNIKRMEYAISVQRLLPLGLKGGQITAADKDDIPFWAKESLKVAVAQGILSGYPDGTLKPSRSVTRAEAVKILFTVFGAGKNPERSEISTTQTPNQGLYE